MSRETWTWDELFEGLDPAPSFVSELERLGLLRVVARDGHGAPLYGAEAREQLEKVLSLVELGYQPKDIAAIARKVGLPIQRRGLFQRPPTYIRLSELARRSGVDEVMLVAWRDRGILRPAMRTEGGDALFSTATVEGAKGLQDLVEFGFGVDELEAWSQLARELERLVTELPARPSGNGAVDPKAAATARSSAAQADEVIAVLRRRVERLRVGLRRWDKLLGGYDKRLERIRRAYGLDEPRRPRLSRRRRPRTRRRNPDEEGAAGSGT